MNVRVFLLSWLVLNLPLGLVVWAADIDIDAQNIGSEVINQPAKRTPFSFQTHIDVVDNAKIAKGFFKGDRVRFAESEVELGGVFYYRPAYTEGARIALSYIATYLGWSENPWFDQDHYQTLSLTLSGFTQRLNRWFWRTQLSVNIDTNEWNARYMSYDLLLWGRYEYNQRVGIHIGFLAQTGMRLDRVWPIIGADWQISRDWKLHIVYPVNVSLEYALSRSWSLALAGRNFNSRHRVNPQASYPKALVRYENIGAEFAIKYETSGLSANLHAGSTLGGKYRIANQYNHHAHNYKLQPASYVGAEIDVKF